MDGRAGRQTDRTDGRTARQTRHTDRHKQSQFPFGLKGQGVNTHSFKWLVNTWQGTMHTGVCKEICSLGKCSNNTAHLIGHTIFPRWHDSMEFQIGLIEITVITRISASSKLLQVPFSFSKYRFLAYILLCKYLLFKFALPFSLPRTYKRLAQPYWGFLRLFRYSETFLRTFITHMHIQSLPRHAATIAENWSLTERRFRHFERTVHGRYLLSCYTVIWWYTVNKYEPKTWVYLHVDYRMVGHKWLQRIFWDKMESFIQYWHFIYRM